jgi:hypothetical protein
MKDNFIHAHPCIEGDYQFDELDLPLIIDPETGICQYDYPEPIPQTYIDGLTGISHHTFNKEAKHA